MAEPNLTAPQAARRTRFATALALALILSVGCANKSIRPATDDGSLTTRVRTALLNDRQVAAQNVQVVTANGVVTLSGSVRTAAERDRAVMVARQTTGVVDVRSELTVSQP
jgi:hyperosmotically inducible protein